MDSGAGGGVSLRVGLRELFHRAGEVEDVELPVAPAASGLLRILAAITACIAGHDGIRMDDEDLGEDGDAWLALRNRVLAGGGFEWISGAAAFGTPPRRRDGPDARPAMARHGGTLPRRREGRHRPRRSRRTPPEHPRDGGEDYTEATLRRAKGGTPPRRRGRLFLTCAARGPLLSHYEAPGWCSSHSHQSEAIEVCWDASSGTRCADGVTLFDGSGMDEDRGAGADGGAGGFPEFVSDAGRD